MDRSAQAARTAGCPVADVLAHVMAHEVGHLLLGPGGHGEKGIMRATWSRVELKGTQNGSLRFTVAEVATMQAGIPLRFMNR
jgi:hypothetical protein